MTVALENELATFRRELPALLADAANQGRFALVHGDAIAALYPTFDTALAAGYEQFGLAPFLVKEVAEHEELRYFSRNLADQKSLALGDLPTTHHLAPLAGRGQ